MSFVPSSTQLSLLGGEPQDTGSLALPVSFDGETGLETILQQKEALALLKQYWGYDQFLPLQVEAVSAILKINDSLMILPTGGGKSLCYQLPALMMEGTAVVVSPLVSLMKDQVDALLALGISAGLLNNSLSGEEKSEVMDNLRLGKYKLLYVAPERFGSVDFVRRLQKSKVSYIVIDEAHCISQWGHDFRPAYRDLESLRQQFPGLGIHAFTATATISVRQDIIKALKLSNCHNMVGQFDRPNLLYRVQYRSNLLKQVCEIINRHPGEGGIIYCISRKDVDELSKNLKDKGYNVLPYHAGLSDIKRQRNQNKFTNETVDIVVATVAFGMGIDRSNIRYVIHTGMPKSVENYQQEAGRAGRDRLEAECVLLYSGSDVGKWRTIMGKPKTRYDELALEKLYEMSNYCQRTICRHRFLVEYFEQDFESTNCQRCDCCLGEYEVLPDSLTVALKILSCALRVEERFGAHHVAQILHGANTEKIRQYGHDKLSTHALLREFSLSSILHWIEQLLNQGFLTKETEYSTLALTPLGKLLIKGEGNVSLALPVPEKVERQKEKSGKGKQAPDKFSKKSSTTSSGKLYDADLFEALRKVRRELAEEKNVPPFIIFSDVSLKEMARIQPVTLSGFKHIKGVGEAKLQQYCPQFLEAIKTFKAD